MIVCTLTVNLGRILGMNWIPIIGKPTKRKPSKTKKLSHAMRKKTSLADEESVPTIFWTQSLSYHWTRTRVTLVVGIHHHCSRSLPSPQSNERLGRLQVKMKSDQKCYKPYKSSSSLTDSCVSRDLVILERHRKTGKLGWSSPYTRMETERMH